MRSTQSSTLETLRRIQGWLDSNGVALGAINASGARKTLDEVILALENHVVGQSAGFVDGKGATSRKRVLRTELHVKHMKPIAAIAQERLRDVPEFSALRLPDPRVSSARLVGQAGAMAEAAAKHHDVFVADGLAADFEDQLRAAARAISNTIDGRAASSTRRVGATQGLLSEERRGRKVVRVLDAMVSAVLRDDALLAEWKSSRKISPKSTGRPAGSASTGSTPAGSGPGSSTPTTTATAPATSSAPGAAAPAPTTAATEAQAA